MKPSKPSQQVKLLVFAASSSRNSINKQLAGHAAQVLQSEFLADVEIITLDLNDYEMPIYSIDRENEGGIHALAHRFFEQIGEADGLLIAYAEHNGSYTSAFKNIFDWTSRISTKVFQSKPMVILSTSPGRRGGGTVLKSALESGPHFGADIVGSLAVPQFRESFDQERGVLKDEALAGNLREALEQLALRLKA